MKSNNAFSTATAVLRLAGLSLAVCAQAAFAQLVVNTGGTVTVNSPQNYPSGVTVKNGTLAVVASGNLNGGSGGMIVGNASGDNGMLALTNGGDVASGYGIVGNQAGSTGTVTVDGSGSTWTTNNFDSGLIVGYQGTGSLAVTNGGAIINGDFTNSLVGQITGSIGTVTVAGAGSSWANSNVLAVGGSGGGTGSLSITNGGLVSNRYGSIGTGSFGGTGAVTVAGAGSTWTNTASLEIGSAGSGTGVVTVDGGTLNAPIITVRASGTLNFNSSSLAAGAIDSTTIANSGLFSIDTRAPIAGSPDARSIAAALTNQTAGVVQVALDNDATITFQGPVVNDGTFHVSQKSGTTNGLADFSGGFTNNGTYLQDPTTTQFDTLINHGTFIAGVGDVILVDNGLVNTGVFNLSGSLLTSLLGLENDGQFNIYEGATINGAYSGIGGLDFHVNSLNDSLYFSNFFSGSLNIVFDDGYSLLGTEQFISFGDGASLTGFTIGGVTYQGGNFSGAGFLTGNGSFVSSRVPEGMSTTLCLLPILAWLAAAGRRRTCC